MVDLDRYAQELRRVPSLTEHQARYLVAQLRSALQKAEAAAVKVARQVEPLPCATGMGVVGLLAGGAR